MENFITFFWKFYPSNKHQITHSVNISIIQIHDVGVFCRLKFWDTYKIIHIGSFSFREYRKRRKMTIMLYYIIIIQFFIFNLNVFKNILLSYNSRTLNITEYSGIFMLCTGKKCKYYERFSKKNKKPQCYTAGMYLCEYARSYVIIFGITSLQINQPNSIQQPCILWILQVYIL